MYKAANVADLAYAVGEQIFDARTASDAMETRTACIWPSEHQCNARVSRLADWVLIGEAAACRLREQRIVCGFYGKIRVATRYETTVDGSFDLTVSGGDYAHVTDVVGGSRFRGNVAPEVNM